MNVLRHQRSAGYGWRAGLLVAALAALGGASVPAAAEGGPPLGAARTFAALGGSTLANSGPSAFVGDVGVSPGSSITGFPPGTVTGGAIHAGDAVAAAAHADAELAYNFLAGMASIPANNLSSVDLGGLTLMPGVYKFNSSAQLTGALTLDAQGDSGALFVFQIGSTLTTATGASVTVINGGADYDESNVFWQIGSSATLGSGTAFVGHILAFSSITVVSGSSMTGNALAINGAVTTSGSSNSTPTVQGGPPPGPVVPGSVTGTTAEEAPCTSADISWTDASADETEFRLYRRDGAGPAFALITTIASTDTPGTGSLVTYQDLGLDPSKTYTYRVTSFNLADGESVFSNDALVETCDETVVPPGPARYVYVHLGRGRSVIRDLVRANRDRIRIRGSYAVIDVNTAVPVVLDDADPRAAGVTIQVGAPGNLLTVTIPPNDPRWRAARRGNFLWRTRDGRLSPITRVRIDTRRSEFTLRSARNELGFIPAGPISVSLTTQSATGAETRGWNTPDVIPRGVRAAMSLPR